MSEHDLQAEIARLNKINQALMNHAERGESLQGSDFNLFRTTVLLEDQVRRRTEELELHNHILFQINQHIPLPVLLDDLVRHIEGLHPGLICSILLLDKDGKTMRHGAAPSLPDFYNQAIDGLQIGDGVGSCGTAAFRGALVIVEDLQKHPYWASHRDLARQAGVQSCWSQPVKNKDGKVLGTFASYHKQPATPSASELALIERYANLVQLIIESYRAQDELHIAATAFESQEGMLITDANNVTLQVNQAFTAITGYQAEDVIGKNPRILSSDRQDATFYAAMWKSLISTGTWEGEIWNKRKNGEIYPGYLSITSVRDLNGTVTNYVAAFSDITERKRAQEEIIFKNTILQTLQETTLDAILVIDENARIISYNQQFIDLWRLPPQMVSAGLDAPVLQSVVAQVENSEAFLARVQYLYEHREDKSREEVRLKNGRIIDRYSAPITGADGKYFGRVWYFREITESKRVEQQLDDYRKRLEGQVAEESTKFRALVEQSLVGNYIIQDGYFRYVNPGLLKMFGYDSAEEVVNVISIYQFVKAEDRPLVEEKILHRLKGNVEDPYSFTAYKRDGTAIIAEVYGQLIEYQGRPAIIGTLVDITEKLRSKEELERLVEEKSAKLRQSEEKLRTLIEAIPDSIQFKDGEGRWLESNFAARAAFGLEAQDCQGKTDNELSEIADPRYKIALQRCHETDEKVWETDGISRVEEIIPLADGNDLIFDVLKKPLFRKEGGREGLIIVGRDVTKLKRAEENLRITASVFGNSQEGIVITDANNILLDVNPAFTQITGYTREEVIGKNPKLLSSGRQDKAFYTAMWESLKQKKTWRGEVWNRRKSGEIYAELLSIAAICDDDGKVLRYVGVFSDISHLKAHEADLDRVAHYDALTGIPNRVLLADRMRQAIAQTAREQSMMVVCYLDLDGFKLINDSMGHEAGDQVLVEVAKRIENTIRGGDTVARLGGDEFVVLLLWKDKDEKCVATLERLLVAIAQPVTVKDTYCTLSASIGVSIYPLDDEDPDTLLRHADQAMYVAKQSGKNRFYIYDTALEMRTRDRHKLLESIRYGLEHDQFELYYQPKIDLRTKLLVGAEALIRWRHPQRGLLSPAEFLRPIENTELDIEVGEWVTATALAQMDHWRQTGLDIEISINISAYHLESPLFVEKLRLQLARYPNIPPSKFQIEVLETAALNDIVIVREIIEACRKLGVGFALDDFGTGYSSLSYLSILPVDVLKIDQSFVRGMLEDKGDMTIVQGIIALARAFELKTVAEGIEIVEHYRALLDMGCEVGQGYYFARPMPADELTNWQADND